jgi:hypothetical protein
VRERCIHTFSSGRRCIYALGHAGRHDWGVPSVGVGERGDPVAPLQNIAGRVFPEQALWLVRALVLGDPRGAAWRERPPEEHRAALERHYAAGPTMDASGYDHRVHAIARLLMEIEVEIGAER